MDIIYVGEGGNACNGDITGYSTFAFVWEDKPQPPCDDRGLY